MSSNSFDLVICDQVPHILPLLRKLTSARILFYCHFPDQLLPGRSRLAIYRRPINRLENRGMQVADAVIVNSIFTLNAVAATFPHMKPESVQVLYPGIDLRQYRLQAAHSDEDEITVLSFNRFKPEKNHQLAVDAFAHLRNLLPDTLFASVRLVIAGGYDESRDEDRRTLEKLREMASTLGLQSQIRFVQSPSDPERLALLHASQLVVYTPEHEHFGFGPLEAMAAGKPVIAVDSGGPTETVRHEETGVLCEPNPIAFASAMRRLLVNQEAAQQMGYAGRKRVEEHFSLESFHAKADTIVKGLFAVDRRC